MNDSILADGIELPIILALGLATFGPLTLVVSLIEALVFRFQLGHQIRKIYGRILWANVISTLTGGVVLAFQDAIFYVPSIHSSIPSFVAGYRWVAVCLILIYFTKSVLVEGLILSTRAFATKLDRTRTRIFKTVALANFASYLLVGPLFYYTTRPTFGNLDLRTETSWTANRSLPVYFIDPENHFVQRIILDKQEQTTVLPHPTEGFVLSSSGEVLMYRGLDKHLYVVRQGDSKPLCASATTRRFFLQSASLSPDRRRLAHTNENENDPYSYDSIKIIDLESGKIEVISGLSTSSWCSVVSWSRDGTQLFASINDKEVAVFLGEPPWIRLANRSRSSVSADELVEAYARYGDRCGYGGGRPFITLTNDSKGDYEVECYPYLGAYVRVSRNDKPVMMVRNDYGLMDLGLPSPNYPTFLPDGTEILLEWWGQLYLLDVERRRMGLITGGSDYVMLIPRFRVGFRHYD